MKLYYKRGNSQWEIQLGGFLFITSLRTNVYYSIANVYTGIHYLRATLQTVTTVGPSLTCSSVVVDDVITLVLVFGLAVTRVPFTVMVVTFMDVLGTFFVQSTR